MHTTSHMKANLPTCFQEPEVLRHRKFSCFTFTTMETYKSAQINGLSITVAMSTTMFFKLYYPSVRPRRCVASFLKINCLIFCVEEFEKKKKFNCNQNSSLRKTKLLTILLPNTLNVVVLKISYLVSFTHEFLAICPM